MEFLNTEIEGLVLIKGVRFVDSRGFFSEMYKESNCIKNGIPRFVQDNMSESARGVIRGLHWQDEPFGQGKLVTCLTGRILDVALDVRPESKTFGRHIAVELSALEPTSLWVPEGFAHGFQSLENETRVFYKVTNYWNKESERSIDPLDSDVGINWPIAEHIISPKDSEAPTLKEVFNY
jgi:dTDP-4-dehydrorhamnose 3,5-epimerase